MPSIDESTNARWAEARRRLLLAAAASSGAVVLEACGGSHHWGRELAGLGHTVRLFIEDVGKVDFRAAYDSDLACISTISSTASARPIAKPPTTAIL